MKNCFDMKDYEVNVIMPMLGRGERMMGMQNTCKPLMNLPDGTLFFLKALSSLKEYKVNQLTLVVLREYYDEFCEIPEYEISQYVDFNKLVITSSEPTANPVESLKKGFEVMTFDRWMPLIVLDCDIYAPVPLIPLNIRDFGVLFYFNDTIGNKSYLQRDDSNNVISIAEKKLISTEAILGAYFFTSGNSAKDVLDSNNTLEYVSEIFASVLGQASIKACSVSNVMNFGTIEELKQLEI